MTLVVQYRGEKFEVGLERGERLLINTTLDWKAKKCDIPEVNKSEFHKWVSKAEVKILGDKKEIGLSGVEL